MGHDRLCYLIMLLLLDMTTELACIWTKCVWGSQTTLLPLFMNSCCNNYVNYLWNGCNMWLVTLNHYDLSCMQVGLKSFMVSVDYRVYMGSSMTVSSLWWLLSYLCSYKLVGSVTVITYHFMWLFDSKLHETFPVIHVGGNWCEAHERSTFNIT